MEEEKIYFEKDPTIKVEDTDNGTPISIIGGVVNETVDDYKKNYLPFYMHYWFIVLATFIFFPLGLFLVWKYRRKPLWIPILITSIPTISMINELIKLLKILEIINS